jgi:putative transposase
MNKFLNKYRSEKARANWWNYSDNGIYFITICTDNRKHYFGVIEKKEMILSEIGLIVQEEWDKSFDIRKELFCDIYVIMPNHIHAILRIANNCPDESHVVVDPHGRADLQHGRADLPISHGIAYRPPKSISSFVAGFKSSATKRINEYRKMPKSPVWQSRFYDRIIRNDDEYFRIEKYILENPQHWDLLL